jgi:CelD/BcsL family acetyltransferase involved in cellulose biosynthesis
LAFAGGGISDYLGLLAEPGRELQVLDEVLRAAENISGWSVLDLTDLAAGSSLLKYERFMPFVRRHDVCFVLPLPETQDQVLPVFSKRQRANLRNARSRTQREGGAKIELAQPSTVLEFLDDLFRLHALRWSEAGQSGVLSDPQVQQFHRAVAPALLSAGILRLYRMRVNDCSIAVVHSLFHRETVFCYLQGFDPAFAHLSPGTQLMFAVIEDAVRLGMRRFDFLRGEEGYKLHWRPQGEPTYRIEVPRSCSPVHPASTLMQES